MERWRNGEIDWEGNPILPGDRGASQSTITGKAVLTRFSKITVLLRLESLPSILAFVNLLAGERAPPAPRVHKAKLPAIPSDGDKPDSCPSTNQRLLEVHGVRLMELTQRTSTVMQVSEVDELQERDPVVNVFRTFGKFFNMAVSAVLSITPESSFAEVLATKAADQPSDLLLVPWSETGSMSDDSQYSNVENRFTSQQHNQFISKTLDKAGCTTAIMVNRGFGGSSVEKTLHRAVSQVSIKSRKNVDILPTLPIADPSHHIFFPFFGGIDDSVALRFVLQLATNINVTATIVRIVYRAGIDEPTLELMEPPNVFRRELPRGLSMSNVPTISRDDAARLPSSVPATDLTDEGSDSTLSDLGATFFQSMIDSLPEALSQRVHFETVETSNPLHYVISQSEKELGNSPKNAGDLIVVGRSHDEHGAHIRNELVDILAALDAPSGAGSETRKCLGDAAEAVIVSGIRASVLVLRAGGRALDPAGEKSTSSET